MGDFKVHHVRFFEFVPNAIHCLAFEETTERVALSRSDGSIEVWSIKDNWYQEKVLVGSSDHTVEALVWCQARLFSAGLHGNITEQDLVTLGPKNWWSCNSGAVWCLCVSPSHSQIAAGTEEGCIVVFDILPETVQYSKALTKQEGRILSIAWHPLQDLLVSGGVDNIRIWSLHSGHAIQRLSLGRQQSQQETIVWSLAVTSDFTIISGDSRGKTCFWNGRQGTLIKSYQSHKADVLTVCVNKEGTAAFSSGVDPAVVQFEYISTQASSDWKMWVRSTVHSQHTNDVRATCIANDHVVSAGVDCQLIFNRIQGQHGIKTWRRVHPIPQVALVSTAKEAGMVLLQYRNKVELWRLGSTRITSVSGKSGEVLPLSSSCMKILELHSKGEPIVCSSVNNSATWLAYSDQQNLRLFQLHLQETEVASPRVSITKCAALPAGLLPAHRLIFTPDGSTLLAATKEGSLQVICLKVQQPRLNTLPSASGEQTGVRLLAVSQNGRYLATGEHNHQVHIYDIRKYKHVATLPTYRCQPSALSFNPVQPILAVAYCDQKVMEYDYENKCYTDWCRRVSSQWPTQWLRRHSTITQLFYQPNNPHHIVLRDEQMFCILDKTQPFPEMKEKLWTKSKWHKDDQPPVNHAFHICTKYKFLLHLDILADDSMVLVERPPVAISDSLPPPLSQKKFGT